MWCQVDQSYSPSSQVPAPVPPGLVRADVSVNPALTTATLLATDDAAPAPSPEMSTPPPTMDSLISSLPPEARWALELYSIPDNGITIAHSLTTQNAIAVSDASLKLNYGTAVGLEH